MTSAQIFREFGVGSSGASGIASSCATMEARPWSTIKAPLVKGSKKQR
jgi:hypothetical protein